MSFETALSHHFPSSLPASEFVRCSYEALRVHGFEASNTIACVSVCRDELTRPLAEDIQNTWGEAFNFSSLAGMIFLGKTGFLAAYHHAPNEDGRERYVYFALPHVAVSSDGEIGVCSRAGRKESSYACGALMAFRKELASGSLRLGLDADDLEQSLLKQRLSGKLKGGDIPDLVTLTKIAHHTCLDELERMIALTVDPTRSHYAVLTGIQIHGPDRRDFVWPGEAYAVVDGNRHKLSLA
ncbi:MAG: hypothetical protein ACE5MM_02075 [Nitrospiraceae bacterium]